MKTKRFLGVLLTITMVMSLLPTFTLTASAAETEEATQKSITLGTSALKDKMQSYIYFGTYQQSSAGNTQPSGTENVDWIKSSTATKNSQGPYYNIEPIKWRVLSNANGKAFLLSDKNLDVLRYNESFAGVTWKTSTIRSWLNGYGASSNQNSIDYSSTNSGGKDNFIDYAFTTSEKALIANTNLVNDDNPSFNTDGGDNTTDKIFLLSIAETSDDEYGFIYTTDRKSANTAYVYGGGHTGSSSANVVGSSYYWWLRSPGVYDYDAANVTGSGYIDEYGYVVDHNGYAVRPAFNLNISSVLFTSAAENGKKSGFNAVSDYSKNNYKLTFKDSSRSFRVSDTDAKTVDGGDILSVSYSNAKTGTNEYISAMIVNSAGEVVYYGQLANATSASGTANLTVPSDIADGTYTLKLFNEQLNGDYKTDYSSDFVNINMIVHPHSYKNGICSCGNYEEPNLKEGYYQIKNAGQLYWFANHINTVDRAANAVLVADIDLEGKTDGTGRKWTPIGSTGENSNNFRGHFDGGNHTITNLYIDETRAGVGLFGEVRLGTVENFTIYGDVKFYGDCSYVGGVIGSAPGANGTDVPDHNGATIRNITSYVNVTLVENAHGSSYVGGFIGYANHETIIENCSWYGTLDLGAYRADSGVGGLVGRLYDKSNVTIRNCGAYGTIKTSYKSGTHNNYDTIYIGGVLSYSPAGTQAVLENNLWAGEFIDNTDLGAKAHLSAFGTLNGKEVVTNCYTIDSVPYITTEDKYTGGITTVTAQQLESGEVAYKLGDAFGQDLSKENSLPLLNSAKVYKYTDGYSNELKFGFADYTADGAVFNIPTAGTYSLVFADYEGGRLENIDIVPVNVTADKLGEITLASVKGVTLATSDKIMLWSDMTSFVPLCDAYVLK